jgi:SAM-dependent methyltransferase
MWGVWQRKIPITWLTIREAYTCKMKLLIRSQKAYRYLLRCIFRFDKWHTSPLRERKYAMAIIRYLNSRPSELRKHVVEIGCGLGDILAEVQFRKKTGYDLDQKVLRACNFMRNTFATNKLELGIFKFPEDQLSGKYDAVLLINWIHHIPPAILISKVQEIFHQHLNESGVIILDTVQDKSYRHNHSIRDISAALNCSVEKLGDFEREREVFSLIKSS